MIHDKEMWAKVKENAIKSRRAQKKNEIKYKPGLIVKVTNFRKLDTSCNHVYYSEIYQVKKLLQNDLPNRKFIQNIQNIKLLELFWIPGHKRSRI